MHNLTNEMEIPKFHETFIPILKVLENGETLQAREMYQKVIDNFYYKLTKEQLQRSPTHQRVQEIQKLFCAGDHCEKK